MVNKYRIVKSLDGFVVETEIKTESFIDNKFLGVTIGQKKIEALSWRALDKRGQIYFSFCISDKAEYSQSEGAEEFVDKLLQVGKIIKSY